jgi:hypothetical protein
MVALCCGRGNDVNATMLLACSPTIATSTGTRSSPPILGRGLIAGKARPLNHSWTQVNSGARRTLTFDDRVKLTNIMPPMRAGDGST